jgi:signal transduction histidine kinase
MSKYREIVITLMEDHERLSDSVVNLTRANSAYMDYARDAQEQGMENERRRITRDIHDIVGYTLTNNMMLMEAAQDIMKENALALPSIIETARQNAQEGLDQVRKAMYKLRSQESAPPTGLLALTQLCKIFEQATSIRVQKNLGNLPPQINDEVDSAVYHFIQEALVNSFRHGKATEVEINFWMDRENLEVSVGDNGLGAGRVVEGIGIKGMRERVGKLGGMVRINTEMKGFHVYATIPVSLPGVKK